jgi:hypothetical protein
MKENFSHKPYKFNKYLTLQLACSLQCRSRGCDEDKMAKFLNLLNFKCKKKTKRQNYNKLFILPYCSSKLSLMALAKLRQQTIFPSAQHSDMQSSYHDYSYSNYHTCKEEHLVYSPLEWRKCLDIKTLKAATLGRTCYMYT